MKVIVSIVVVIEKIDKGGNIEVVDSESIMKIEEIKIIIEDNVEVCNVMIIVEKIIVEIVIEMKIRIKNVSRIGKGIFYVKGIKRKIKRILGVEGKKNINIDKKVGIVEDELIENIDEVEVELIKGIEKNIERGRIGEEYLG